MNKNPIIYKIAESAAKSAPRYIEDADLLISQIIRDLELKSEQELEWCGKIVNRAIHICKQGKGAEGLERFKRAAFRACFSTPWEEDNENPVNGPWGLWNGR